MNEKLKELLSMERDVEANKFFMNFLIAFSDFLNEVEKTLIVQRENTDFEKMFLTVMRELHAGSFTLFVMPFIEKMFEEE